jgi:hypothetical protein
MTIFCAEAKELRALPGQSESFTAAEAETQQRVAYVG